MAINGETGSSSMVYWLRIISKNLDQLNKVAGHRSGTTATVETTTPPSNESE